MSDQLNAPEEGELVVVTVKNVKQMVFTSILMNIRR